MENYRILVIDDEENQREAIAGFLRKRGFETITASGGSEGIDIIKHGRGPVDIVLTDYRMPDADGLRVLRESKAVNPEISVVIITAYGTVEGAVEAMKEGAFDYLSKPIDLDELDSIVRNAVERKRLISENRELRRLLGERYRFEGIIGESGAIQNVINTTARVAPSRATVLIRGESGTGKELIARAIHYASPRHNRPFVIANCAALPETLLESELFGHEKGAFTGADRRRIGRFEEANGGTLFIDEVGDIPVSAQAKLLRAIQEGEIGRLGSNEVMKVDVRIIAATHTNLEKMMDEGSFREDLFYRLNVVSVLIPPLRERRSDIRPLVEHFIKKYAEENEKDIKEISRETMDLLMRYDYPGNVRELENIIEGATIMTRNDVISSNDLPMTIRGMGVDLRPGSRTSLPEMVEGIERDAIVKALRESDWVQVEAARTLGITERNLRYKMKKYGIKRT